MASSTSGRVCSPLQRACSCGGEAAHCGWEADQDFKLGARKQTETWHSSDKSFKLGVTCGGRFQARRRLVRRYETPKSDKLGFARVGFAASGSERDRPKRLWEYSLEDAASSCRAARLGNGSRRPGRTCPTWQTSSTSRRRLATSRAVAEASRVSRRLLLLHRRRAGKEQAKANRAAPAQAAGIRAVA